MIGVVDESETYSIDSQKLGRLLRLYSAANEAEETDIPEDKRTLLGDLLSGPLPLDEKTIDGLPTILKRLCEQMPPVIGRALGSLLNSPDTELEHLSAIKEYAKEMVSTADTEAKYETRIVVYYAAIAAALVFHSQKITKYSFEKLESSFSSLAQRDWVTDDLVELFNKARQIRRSKE